MSGFFKKLIGGNKKPTKDHDVDLSASDELWTEHETTDEIVSSSAGEKSAPKRKDSLDLDSMSNDSANNSATIAAKVPESQEDPPNFVNKRVVIKDLETSDIELASDFSPPSQSAASTHPIDEVTRQIQEQIAKERFQKEKLEKLRRLQEATDKFRRPEWADELIKKE